MTAKRFQYIKNNIESSKDSIFIKTDLREDISYSQFIGNALAILNQLVEHDISYGDTVIVSLPNSHRYLELIMALAIGGIQACPIDPSSSKCEKEKIEQLTCAKIIIDSMDKLRCEPNDTIPSCAYQGDEHSPFLIVFSSGTTGSPKGIVQSFIGFFAAAKSFSNTAKLKPENSTLHNWPMFYYAGLFNLFACPFMSAGKIICTKKFTAKNLSVFWEKVRKEQPDYIYLSPTMAMTLCKTSALFKVESNIFQNTAIITTSSILYPSIAQEFENTFAKRLTPCFGITELGGSFTIAETGAQQPHSSYSTGKPIPEVEINTSQDSQELLVKSPYMAIGYLKPQGLIEHFNREAYFKTGDLASIIDGELFIHGRLKDTIKKGGEFIQLSEVENIGLQEEYCMECLAIGRPDKFWGEVYDLFFTHKEYCSKDATKKMSRHIKNSIPNTLHRPENIIPLDEIPKTASGKPLKREVDYREYLDA